MTPCPTVSAAQMNASLKKLEDKLEKQDAVIQSLSKGKGKGKGTGQGAAAKGKGGGKKGKGAKGQSRSRGKGNGEWPCHVPGCDMCDNEKLNRATRDVCMGCDNPRGAVQDWTQGDADDQDWTPVKSQNQLKKEAKARGKGNGAQATPNAKETKLEAEVKELKKKLAAKAVEEGTEVEEEEEEKEDEDAAAKALQPHIQKALMVPLPKPKNVESLYVPPKDQEGKKTAEEIVLAGMKGQEETTFLKGVLEQTMKERETIPDSSYLAEICDKKIKELKESHEAKVKILKDTGYTSIETMKSKRQNHSLEEAKRKSAGLNKTEELETKYLKMRDAVRAERDRLSKLLDTMEDLEIKSLAKWKEHHDTKATLWAKVDEVWDAKISAKTQEVDKIHGQKAGGTAPEVAPTLAQIPGIGLVPSPKLREQREDLERTNDAATIEEIPKMEVDYIKDNMETLQNLWALYGMYRLCGPPAMTYASSGAKLDMIKTIVGQKIWDGFYKDRKAKVVDKDVMPRQIHVVVNHALCNMDADFKKSAELEAAIKIQWTANKDAALAKALDANASRTANY